MTDKGRGGYPSDVTDKEWAFVLPYLLLCREDSPQRKHELRTVFNAVRYMARTGGQWRSCRTICRPGTSCISRCSAGSRPGASSCWWRTCVRCCDSGVGRKGQPTAVVIDSRTLQSTPESGACAGYDGAKRRKGSKVHIAVDTLGHLLAPLPPLAWRPSLRLR
jgi:transposase